MAFAGKQAVRLDDLIYDVGMHKGEDSEYYLKKGFRVVAFEANPDLVAENRQRFARDLSKGRLTIVAGAIVPNPQVGRVRFFKNLNNSVWGTIDPQWAERNAGLGTQSQVIEVDAVDFEACLQRYGMPHYMKIDIEGADQVCLRTLMSFETRPSYISIEAERESFEKLTAEINLLTGLGYESFQARQQQGIEKTRLPHPSNEGRDVEYTFEPGSSGPFGRDLPDQWKTRAELLEQYRGIISVAQRFGEHTWWRRTKPGLLLCMLIAAVSGQPFPGWYDTHARLRF